MAQTNPLKPYLDAGLSFAELTQARAEAIVTDLMKAGEVQSEQVQATVTEFLERSRRNTEALIEQVLAAVRERADSLGLVTQEDLTRLIQQVTDLRTSVAASSVRSAARKATGRRSSAKKSTAKKSAAKKSTAKKSPAKKSTAKKSTAAKKSPAKRAAAKKATAKRSTAKRSTAKKTTAKKTTAKKTTAKKSAS